MFYAPRVKETTTTAGTGTIDLDGAASGFQGFVAAGAGGLEVEYTLIDGTAWEVGIGTITDATPDTLSRDTLLASSTGSKISLSGGSTEVHLSVNYDSIRRFRDLADSQIIQNPFGGAKFNGSTYLARGSDLTGNADGKKGILSVFIDKKSGDGSTIYLYHNTSGYFFVTINSSNNLRIRGANTSNTTVLELISTSTILTTSGLVHILASWDLSTGYSDIYLNDAQETLGTDTTTDDNIDYTRTDFAVASTTIGSGWFDGPMAQNYLNLVESLDLTIEANRRKFIRKDLKPAELGMFGKLPTGNQPIIYLPGDERNFQTNRGSGGNFSVTGTLLPAENTFVGGVYTKNPRIVDITFRALDKGTNLSVADYLGNSFVIPDAISGWEFHGVQHARVDTAGTTGSSTIQIANVTQAVDVLSTLITIESGATSSRTAATPSVVNASNKTVTAGDVIRIDCDSVSTTAPKGLELKLRFLKP